MNPELGSCTEVMIGIQVLPSESEDSLPAVSASWVIYSITSQEGDVREGFLAPAYGSLPSQFILVVLKIMKECK